MKIIFLYTRLASYFMTCVNELAKHVAEIHIVCSPPDVNAPFTFEPPANVFIHSRKDFTTQSLIKFVEGIQPNLITSSGWRDFSYLTVCKRMKGRMPVVLLMDNQWRNSLKQRFLCLISSRFLQPVFTHVWVPGSPQDDYARRLGFKPAQIIHNFYCADTNYFGKFAHHRIEAEQIPRRFLYIGRYVHEKGIDILINAFTTLQIEHPNNWELWCVGTGPLTNQFENKPGIKHFGFLQPSEMDKILSNCGVFVLPSRFEQWGVVIQEMAASGFPLIASSAVGAAVDYLEEGQNGFSFESECTDSLKSAILRMIQMTDVELVNMARHSHKVGLMHTPEKWAEMVMGFSSGWPINLG
jgi:glycosyltransferase involved in cell wall biosynthesis